jgi:DNA polymerase-3 subunit beta
VAGTIEAMKITCDREKLLSAFQTAATVAPPRSPKVILQNVKLDADPQATVLMATDMEVGIRIEVVDVEVSMPGAAILPVARFGALLRESTDEKLSLEAGEQGVVVRGERSEFRLPGAIPDEFPDVSGFRAEGYYELSARLLKEMIRRTLFATDTESGRYALGGVVLELGPEQIVAVATDGRRLAKMEGPLTAVGDVSHPDTSTIVPSRSLQLIDRAIHESDGEVRLVAHPNEILIGSPRATIHSRLVEGRFPKWRDVIPDRRDGQLIEMTVGPILSAVRQASIVSNDESRGLTFSFGNGTLVLAAQTADVGQTRIELPIPYDAEPIMLVLDNRYVADFLKVLNSEATFSMNVRDADSAALCTTGDGYSYVLMPLARDKAVISA